MSECNMIKINKRGKSISDEEAAVLNTDFTYITAEGWLSRSSAVSVDVY